MAVDPQWIIAGVNSIAAFGIVLVGLQLRVSILQLKELKRQIAADHERSRRARAIDVLADWTKQLDKSHPSARTLVESFDHEQCQKLKDRKAFYITAEKEKLLENALYGHFAEDRPKKDEKGERILLNENHVSHLYYLCITHLNSLEVVLQSWLNGIADKEILDSELNYLIQPSKNHYVLERLRNVMGSKATYPAIEVFVEHIKKQKKDAEGTKPLPSIA